MTTALDTRRALTPKWTKEQVELMKRTIAKGTTDDEFKMFLYTCKRTGLDPFVKQIYAIKRYDAESGGYIMGIQVGIDGMRLIASRTEQLAGIDAAIFTMDLNEPWHPDTATVTVYRMNGDERIPYTHTVRWSEYCQKKKDGTLVRMWSQNGMPFNQLGKCAEAGALRKGFPNDLSGLTTADESPVIDISAADGVTGAAEEVKPDVKAGTMYTGQLAGHVPKDPSRKTPHRLIIKLDAGGEMNLGTFELPACIKEPQKFMGRRLQFTYDEKPNPRGGEPFRNLTHLALEEVTAEEEKKPQEDGGTTQTSHTTSQTATSNQDAPAAPSGDPAEPYRAKIRTTHTEKECNDTYNAIPEEIRQNCYNTYTEKLKDIAANKPKR